jgi:GT2 family glycosyltransferase
VIVTWNSAAWIDRCLDALAAACEGIDHEVIVFDNASSDPTARAVTSRGQGVQFIASTTNTGFAAGVNKAVGAAKGRHFLLLNPDCEPSRGSVTELVRFLDEHQDVAAAVPLLMGDDGLPQRDFQLRRLPTIGAIAAEVLMLNKLLPNNRVIRRAHYRDLALDGPQVVEQPAAAAMLIRRDAFDRIGELDERFVPAWFEDVDFCKRLNDAGDKICLVPTALVLHHGGASLSHVSFEHFADVWYRNLYAYSRKWMRSRSEVVRWMIISGMALRIGALLVGVSGAPAGRRVALKAYSRVMRRALSAWHDASPSS